MLEMKPGELLVIQDVTSGHWEKTCLFVSFAQQTITILPMATCRLPLSLELAPLLLDSFRMKGYEGIRENIGSHLAGPQIHMYSLYKTHTPLPTVNIINPISPFLHNFHIIRALAWELCLICGFRLTICWTQPQRILTLQMGILYWCLLNLHLVSDSQWCLRVVHVTVSPISTEFILHMPLRTDGSSLIMSHIVNHFLLPLKIHSSKSKCAPVLALFCNVRRLSCTYEATGQDGGIIYSKVPYSLRADREWQRCKKVDDTPQNYWILPKFLIAEMCVWEILFLYWSPLSTIHSKGIKVLKLCHYLSIFI